MAIPYTLTPVTDLPKADPTNVDSDVIRVGDVKGLLRNVRLTGDRLAAWDGGQIRSRRYMVSAGDSGVMNHFQGFRRLKSGKYFALSGGDWKEGGGSHVFFVKMTSRAARGPWFSNVHDENKPPTNDKIVKTLLVDEDLWHAGGIDSVGDILAVPVEKGPDNLFHKITDTGRDDTPASRIVFLDVTDPENPRAFKNAIERPSEMATCTAITKLPNGRVLVAVWAGSTGRIDFYLARTDPFDGTFTNGHKPIVSWPGPGQTNLVKRFAKFSFQTMNFIHQPGELYLAGLGAGDGNRVQLYSVTHPSVGAKPVGTAAPASVSAGPTGNTLVAPKIKMLDGDFLSLNCPKKVCDLAAAAGVYVGDDELLVYSGWQYRTRDGVFRFTEFRPRLGPKRVTITKLEDAWIELFSGLECGGDALAVRGLQNGRGDLPRYSKIRVDGDGFDKRARSMRWQLPAGTTYKFYRDDDFKKQVLQLTGDGGVGVIDDFRDFDADKKIRSSRLL